MITFIVGLVILLVGAMLYGRFCEHVFKPDDRKTPAYTKQDGVDYVPMREWKNSLINLLNIAGTGPILGPIQGILFGPIAFIMIPIGNIIGGAMHDYFSGMICLRDGGTQMPDMIRRYSNKGVYTFYQIFCSLLLLLVGAVFIYTPGDIAATQVFGFDGKEKIVDLEMEFAREIMEKKYKGRDLGSKGGDLWWENKYKFFYPGYMFHIPQAFGTLDTVADFAHIEKVYWAMKKAVNENFPQARFIGHFSHWYEWGCMLYARFIFEGKDVPQDADKAAELYNRVWDVAIREAIANGGVINEHHGVGLKLGRYMKDLYKNSFPILQGIKKTLDPNNIMNPGKMGL